MNTSVASWEFPYEHNLALLPPPSTYLPSSSSSEYPVSGHGVSELMWVNGQLSMHGFDTIKRLSDSRLFSSTTTATATSLTNDDPTYWLLSSSNETLESIVDEAHRKTAHDDRVPWFMAQHSATPPVTPPPPPPPPPPAAVVTTSLPMDATVPCSGSSANLSSLLLGGAAIAGGRCVVTSSTRVESCSAGTFDNKNARQYEKAMKRAKLTEAAPVADYSSRDNSVSGTMDSQQITIDTGDWEFDVQGGCTGTSLGSPGNTSSANKTAADDRDSVGPSRPQRGAGEEKEKKKGVGGKASTSAKRSRAAAVHNQSERKRRDRINDRMRTLQKLVPHSSKTDKASMLDEVIEYLKQLQSQINMMSRMGMSPMNMNPMMMPLALQQQMHMQMMSQMGMGMGMNPMGMGMMEMNAMGRPNVPGLSPPVLHPNPFMPMQHPPQWDMTTAAATNAASASDRVCPVPAGPPVAPTGRPLVPDPISTSLLAFQAQPMTLEGYSKMAAMFHQMNQAPKKA